MRPHDIINKMLDTGICFQLKVDKGEINPFDSMQQPKLGIEIVKDKQSLLLFNAWFLARNIPNALPKDYYGASSSFTILNGKLIIETSDVPWAKKVQKHIFNIEYIKNIEYNKEKGLLLITSTLSSVIIEIK